MNILKTELPDFDRRLENHTFKVRLNSQQGCYRFGEVRAEIPNYLAKRFHALGMSYFNLDMETRDGAQTLYLSHADCMHLARLFAQFRESPISIFRRNVMFELEDLIGDEAAGVTLGNALEILSNAGKSIFDLDEYIWRYEEAMKPKVINGFPGLTTAFGDFINIALNTNKDKWLVLNSYYYNGDPNYNGPGGYENAKEPTAMTLTLSELSTPIRQF